MKKTRILKLLVVAVVVIAGMLAPLVPLSGVVKADIDPKKCLFTPETVLFSAECADLYKKDCKSKDLGTQFCENLTYQEIARCADSEKGATVVKSCLEALKDYKKNPGIKDSLGCLFSGGYWDPLVELPTKGEDRQYAYGCWMVDIPQNKTICKKTAVNWYPDQDPPSGVKSHLTFPLGSDQKVGLCTVKLSNAGVCQDDSDCTTDPSPIGTEYDSHDCENGLEGSCKMIDLIITITNAVSGMAAAVIVAMIVWGGIQYSMAGADASKVQAAKQKITNALIALLLLIFGFSLIQWLVPGGLI